nr:reverse transcriptase domain-containing protein [Tanacetum cinerariifolium]
MVITKARTLNGGSLSFLLKASASTFSFRSEHSTFSSIQIVPPNLKGEHYCSKFQVVKPKLAHYTTSASIVETLLLVCAPLKLNLLLIVAKVNTNTSTSGISPDVAELKDIVKALLLDKISRIQAPATVKAIEESCVTCGGAHSYRNCPPPMAMFIVTIFKNSFLKPSQLTTTKEIPSIFVNSNNASTSNSGTLPSNTIANPRSDLKAITTRSGVSYDGPQITPPTSFLPKVVENELEATKDTVNPTNNRSTKDVQPQVVQSKSLILNSEPVISPIFEPVIAPVSAPKPNRKSLIPYPSRRNDERNHEKAKSQIEKFYQIFKDMSFEISFADALILMPKFDSTLKALIGNKEKLSEMARTSLNEHCSV